MKLKPAIVGATFLAVMPSMRHRQPPQTETVRVTKIGRVWATYEVEGRTWSTGRFDLEKGTLDGGQYSSPGRVFNDRAHYESHARTAKLWEELRREVSQSYAVPNGLDEVGVLKAADALGFKLKGE